MDKHNHVIFCYLNNMIKASLKGKQGSFMYSYATDANEINSFYVTTNNLDVSYFDNGSRNKYRFCNFKFVLIPFILSKHKELLASSRKFKGIKSYGVGVGIVGLTIENDLFPHSHYNIATSYKLLPTFVVPTSSRMKTFQKPICIVVYEGTVYIYTSKQYVGKRVPGQV